MYDTLQARCAAINNSTSGDATELFAKPVMISPFDPTNAYKHHAFIAEFKGKLHAIWSQGDVDEDACGQHVMTSASEDGSLWSPPRPLVERRMGQVSELVFTADGLYSDGETLSAYYFAFEYRPEFLRGENLRPGGEHYGQRMSCFEYVITTEDGVNWSAPVEIPLTPNMPPKKLASGRLLKVGAPDFAYTDDPKGIIGWQTSQISKEDEKAMLNDGAKLLCEGSAYQTDDGIIHCMIRSNAGYLYCSESSNDGESWSRPYKTGFTNDSSKTFFDRLPDGRYYFVGSFSPAASRYPLFLCVSEDGYNFHRHYILRSQKQELKQKGMDKGGSYGYPFACIRGDTLWVIYSVMKEEIELCSIPLESI